MLVHNLSGDSQADTRTGRFGGEERNEDAFLHFRFDTGSIISNTQAKMISWSDARGKSDLCRFVLAGIPYQVAKDLLYLFLIRNETQCNGRQREMQITCFILHQLDRFPQQFFCTVKLQ